MINCHFPKNVVYYILVFSPWLSSRVLCLQTFNRFLVCSLLTGSCRLCLEFGLPHFDLFVRSMSCLRSFKVLDCCGTWRPFPLFYIPDFYSVWLTCYKFSVNLGIDEGLRYEDPLTEIGEDRIQIFKKRSVNFTIDRILYYPCQLRTRGIPFATDPLM